MEGDFQDRARVGIVPLMIDLYDRLLPKLRDDLTGLSHEIAQELTSESMEVMVTHLVGLEEEIQGCLTHLQAKDVDLLVLCHLAYCPSGQIERALRGYCGPVLLWPGQSIGTIDPETFHASALSRNHGVHGTQDLANVLRRRGRPYGVLHGHWRDPSFLESLHLWAKAGKASLSHRACRASGPTAVDACASPRPTSAARIPAKGW